MKTYLVTDGKLYKIGQSNDPLKRLSVLKTANPKARIIAFGEGVSEKYLHHVYKSRRIDREWFDLKNIDVCNIIRYLKNEMSTTINPHIQKTSKSEEDIFKSNSNFIFGFGKYKGSRIIDMNSEEELKYIKWLYGNIKLSKIKRILKWWLIEHSLI